MIFSAGREGLLPFGLGKISKYGTPWATLVMYSGVALVITLVWASQGQVLSEAGVIGTLGTIPIALVYLALNIALPVYYLKHHRNRFSWWKHLTVPILGTLLLILPLWGLIQPGQPAPFNLFPGIVLIVLVIAFIYALIRSKQVPDLSEKVGSVIADE
jgi:amino acid transporter